ncbi:hypothetical protein IV203_016981 [Nitzschia inconspicua]|uniref:Extradiol ring-cleavage dioxygenase class III enzyme subunit B domain-containing protein n=1 Tax=Nitzschia inconspicua TaxID=303405 RepID=A0A9K3K6V3_9STRA|nr:hypothetical protein IV203_017507 [Nitzschia inconspicua]KAG7348276.1 hypothetical protein IV203_016981 [Nitzschia inconspicua]
MFAPSQAVFTGTILLPHGDFALDPTFCRVGSKERLVADDIAAASRTAARWLLNQEPEIVILTTPHGLQLDYDYGIYHGNQASGEVVLGQDLVPDDKGSPCNSQIHSPYNVSVDSIDLVDFSVSNDLLQSLQPQYPVSAIYSPNNGIPIPLYWGEIVPLLFLLQQQSKRVKNPSSSSPQGRQQTLPFRTLVWTFPHRRYEHSPEMVPELLAVGADIMSWISKRPERIAVVVSGDLAHTHLTSGPYGYSNTSLAYDAAIDAWLNSSDSANPCHPNAQTALLELARSLQPAALSCGFTGYVLWHGMMQCQDSTAQSQDHTHFRSKLLGLGNVTYYGMCSGLFEEIQDRSIFTATSNTIVSDTT